MNTKNNKSLLPIGDPHWAPWKDENIKPYLQLQNLVCRFEDTLAINDVSLDIYQGEFFALLGPSGCGKTTLLRMLAGFERNDSGKILLGGEDLSKVPAYLRPVNMMFQSYALFPHLNVYQNIAFGLKQEKMPKAEIIKRVEEMMVLTRLTSFAKRKPHQLSGGQKQRVALARSLAKRPKLLLLDEPLGALDRKLREATQFELVNIQEKLGMTFVIVTHDQEEAMTVASRIAVMDQGRIVQVGLPSELYETPHNLYVAGFIGDANIIQAKVSHNDKGAIYLKSAVTENFLVVETQRTPKVSQTVWLALRPEKIKMIMRDNSAYQNDDNTVTGRIVDIGYLGDVSVYHIALDNGFVMRCSQTNHVRKVERPFTWNDEVILSWHNEAAVMLEG